MSTTATPRSRIACRAPHLCNVTWHWDDTEAACMSAASAPRRSLDTLIAPPVTWHGTASTSLPALTLHVDEESWDAISAAAVSVHGLHVNRHALAEVFEEVTSNATPDFDAMRSQPEHALALEVLCLDKSVRLAAISGAMGNPSDGDSQALIAQFEEALEARLAQGGPTDQTNLGTSGLSAFPYTRARVAGLLDAAFEARKKQHAWTAMSDFVKAEIVALSAQAGLGSKFDVASGGSVVSNDGKRKLGSGEIAVTLSNPSPKWSAAKAQSMVDPEVWRDAQERIPEEDISVTLADATRAARKEEAGVNIDDFVVETTAEIKIFVRQGDAVSGAEVDATTKSLGVAEFEAGRNVMGSHFYVPDTSQMSPEKALATLARARVRADKRKEEAKEIANTLHSTIRKVASLALNETILCEDSNRTFTFQVNKKRSLDVERLSQQHPQFVSDIRASKRGKATPSLDQFRAALDASGLADDADTLIEASSSVPEPTLMVKVFDAASSKAVAPSALGKAAAQDKIKRGLALSGRVFTEALSQETSDDIRPQE